MTPEEYDAKRPTQGESIMKIIERNHPTTGKLMQVDIYPFVAESDDIGFSRACLTVDLDDRTVYPNVNGYKMSAARAEEYQAAFAKALEILYSPASDDAPDPLEEIEIEHAEMGDVDDYDQLRIERGEFETENYQLKQQLAATTAERDELKAARELWTTLRREIWELVQQADFDNPLANELETLLK